MANRMEALLFVSIHANSANTTYSEGIETFIAPNKVAKAASYWPMLCRETFLKELKRNDRGIKQEDFYVIKYTDMPGSPGGGSFYIKSP